MSETATDRPPVTLADIEAEIASSPVPTLEEAIEDVAGEIRQRCRLYPGWTTKGTYKLPTAAQKIKRMRKALAALEYLAANQSWIRAEAQRRQKEARLKAEAETLKSEPKPDMDLRNHPAVKTVMEEFGSPYITDVIERAPQAEAPNPEAETENAA